MNVFVVTGLELGWDCVVAVFNADEVDYNELVSKFPSEYYVIHDKKIETSLKGWE